MCNNVNWPYQWGEPLILSPTSLPSRWGIYQISLIKFATIQISNKSNGSKPPSLVDLFDIWTLSIYQISWLKFATVPNWIFFFLAHFFYIHWSHSHKTSHSEIRVFCNKFSITAFIYFAIISQGTWDQSQWPSTMWSQPKWRY